MLLGIDSDGHALRVDAPPLCIRGELRDVAKAPLPSLSCKPLSASQLEEMWVWSADLQKRRDRHAEHCLAAHACQWKPRGELRARSWPNTRELPRGEEVSCSRTSRCRQDQSSRLAPQRTEVAEAQASTSFHPHGQIPTPACKMHCCGSTDATVQPEG